MGQFELDFQEVLRSLPSLREVSAATLPRSADCFIGVVGFENRCYAAAETLARLEWHARQAFAVHYIQEDMREVNEAHRETLSDYMLRITRGEPATEVEHDDHKLDQDFGEGLLMALRKSGVDVNDSGTYIAFDISAGSSRLLLEGLHALLNTRATVVVLYSEASEYRPSFQEYLDFVSSDRAVEVPTAEFLSYGVDKVELLKRMPGQAADGRPTYLVVFPSFTPTRIIAVIDELTPSGVHWVFGVPNLVKNRWRIDAQKCFHSELIEKLHRHCYVGTFDYRETVGVLEAIYQKRRNHYNILTCSLGSKLQKLGQVLFHLLRPEVGAVVSVPKRWDPREYSSREPRAVHMVEFGDCQALRDDLWATRTLRL